MPTVARLSVTCALVTMWGCSQKQPTTQTSQEPPADAHAPQTTPAQTVSGMLSALNGKDFSSYAKHYAADAKLTLAGLDDETVGPDAIRANYETFWSAFPDAKMTTHVQLQNGAKFALLVSMTGTHSQPLQTATGSLPATQRKLANWGLLLIETDDDHKIRAEHHYYDMRVILGQLQNLDTIRPAVIPASTQPKSYTAADQSMPAWFTGWLEALNKRDKRALASHYTKTANVMVTASQADHAGGAATTWWQHLHGAFSDLRVEAKQNWQAGPYAIAQLHISGTNDGKLPGLITKPTRRKVEFTVGTMTHTENGKISQQWVIVNTMALLARLQLVGPAQ